ncbi:MAG TPA: outer membrane beta-barrel protein [Pseudolabrys sp.]|nr:outer membrane beta-barrel protein [Pseudolabrys sp.]
MKRNEKSKKFVGVDVGLAAMGQGAPRFAIAICSLLASVVADRAMAADWPLRGSVAPSYMRWDGWQAGVQVGYGNLNTDFGDSTGPLVAFILRNSTLENEAQPSSWTTLPRNSTNGPVFGGFVGYNVQWSELVLGADLAYMHPSVLQSNVGDSLTRVVTTSDNVQHTVTISAQSNFKLVDYATLRARAGYAFDQFLPYAAVGLAVGRFNYGTTVTVTDNQLLPPNPPGTPSFFQQSASAGQNNVFAAGVAAALGLDWAVTPSVFLRGEWQFIAWSPVNQTRSNVQTGQLGVGVRFW